jgi:hypothetical protein
VEDAAPGAKLGLFQMLLEAVGVCGVVGASRLTSRLVRWPTAVISLTSAVSATMYLVSTASSASIAAVCIGNAVAFAVALFAQTVGSYTIAEIVSNYQEDVDDADAANAGVSPYIPIGTTYNGSGGGGGGSSIDIGGSNSSSILCGRGGGGDSLGRSDAHKSARTNTALRTDINGELSSGTVYESDDVEPGDSVGGDRSVRHQTADTVDAIINSSSKSIDEDDDDDSRRYSVLFTCNGTLALAWASVLSAIGTARTWDTRQYYVTAIVELYATAVLAVLIEFVLRCAYSAKR